MTSSREVIGQRLDPEYTLKIGFLNSLQSKYPFILMKDIIDRPPQYGANEESIEGKPNTDIRYIRITDIDELGNLRLDIFRTAAVIDNQYLLSENDLLFARSGATAGKCYIHKSSGKNSIFAGYLIRFRLKSDIALPDYVFYFCNSKLYAYWVSMIQRPSAQPNINSEEFKSLLIPLPPLEKQSEIAYHITSIRQHAFKLKEEASNILELARKHIEIMILGE
jgi:Type I restriction modification DNA specificity domain.